MAQAMQTRFVGHSRGRYLLVTGIDSKSSINDVMMMFNRFNLMPIAINIFHVRCPSSEEPESITPGKQQWLCTS